MTDTNEIATVGADDEPAPAPMRRPSRDEFERMTPSERLDFEERWRQHLDATGRSARAEAERLAELDRELALTYPSADEIKPQNITQTSLQRLCRGAEDSFAEAAAGPPWAAPERMYGEARAMRERSAGQDLIAAAAAAIAYASRWRKITGLSSTDRVLLENRTTTAQAVAKERQAVEMQERTAAALGRHGFSPAAWLAGMIGRGMRVWLEGDAIRVSPASSVNDEDRRVLGAHRAAIVALLSDRGEQF